MITDALLGLLEAVWGFLLDFVETNIIDALPDIDLPDLDDYTGPAETVWEWTAWANWYVPLDHALIIIGVTVGAWTTLYAIRFFDWLATKAHILGGE